MKLEKLIIKSIIGLGATLLVYTGSMVGIQIYSKSKAIPIKDQAHAEQILEEQQKKLGIEDKIIRLRIPKDYDSSSLGKSRRFGNTYIIQLNTAGGKNDATLKHEVYHIADGHCDSKTRNPLIFKLKYIFYWEPQSIMYEAFGWEL